MLNLIKVGKVVLLWFEKMDNINPSSYIINDLIHHYEIAQYDKAESKALSITKDFPKHQLSWKVLQQFLSKKIKMMRH